jgi:HlyD family secretion protein
MVLAAIAVAIAAGLVYGFRPQPVSVDVATAMRQPLQVTVEQEGKTRVVDRYVVASPVAGYTRRINLDVGDSVRQGQALAWLEPRRSDVLDARRQAEARAHVAAAEARLNAAQQRVEAAQADAELAKTELARIRQLRAENNTSQGDEDRALAAMRRTEAEQRSAQFAAKVAQHELDAARTALQYAGAAPGGGTLEHVVIRSPVMGRVLKIQHQSEGPVDVGEPLLEIGNPRTLEVEIDVLSADAVRIQSGTPVLFERWGGEQPLRGAVRTVEPTGFTKISALGVEEQRVWVIADITSPPDEWERLGDGYRVEASFILWEENDVLQIPDSALFRDGENWSVFTVRDDQAVKQAIEVGQRNGISAQILTGLQAGDEVITHPDDKISNGVVVQRRH